MGGYSDSSTAFESITKNNPFCKFTPQVYEWFLYSAGIYLGELLKHVLIDARGKDFGEMLIHHLATIFLVFGSAYANQIGIGAIISWLHIATDIPASWVKLMASTHYNDATVVVFFITISSWFYFRLLCLPFWIINIFTNPAVGYPDHISQFDIFHTLIGLYLLVIQMLQVYWFALFIRMLCAYSQTGVAEDT